MQEFSELLEPLSELIKIIGVIGGAFVVIYRVIKKIFDKELGDKLQDIETKLDDIHNVNQEQMTQIKESIKNQNVLLQTNKNILKNEITYKYYAYTGTGFLPLYQREALTAIYGDYKELHGNSYVDTLYKELMELPTQK